MASNQPEPSSSRSPESHDADVGLCSESQPFCDVNFVNDDTHVGEYQNDSFVNHFKGDENLSPVVGYAQYNVEPSDSSGNFVQSFISGNNVTNGHQNHFDESSDAEVSQEQFVNDLSSKSKHRLVDTMSQDHLGHPSAESSSTRASPQVMSLNEESVNSHQSKVQVTEAVLERVSLDQLNLQHVSVLHHGVPTLTGLPIFLDRNSLAAFMSTSRADGTLCLETAGLPRSVISSLSPRTLASSDQSQYLNADPTLVSVSSSLLSPILSQRDILPPVMTTSSSPTLNTLSNSYPLTHKQMLFQKYAAELEAPSSGANLMSDINMNGRVSSPYVTASSSTTLIDSHPMSVFGDSVSTLTSTSASQCLPIEAYSVDRSVALVSSSRDSPEDIINNHIGFSDVSHASSHSGVQNYVSSSVDLVHNHHMDQTMHCDVDSTVTVKLHQTDENVVDSSDTYCDHVTSCGALHSSSHVNYDCNMEVNSCDDDPARNALDTNEALSSTTGQVFSTHIQFSGTMVNNTTEELRECSTVSSASHPDSTHSPIGLGDADTRIENIVNPDEFDPSLSDFVGSECNRPRRDLRRCEDCSLFYDKECPQHRVQLIFDKPVLSRAWASLPATYLYVNKIGVNETGDTIYGVFSKKMIPKRTQFGPVEGILVKQEDPPTENFVFVVEHENGAVLYLDTSDEAMSNWMRFVRPADSHKEQNLVLVQQGTSLFFNTTKCINPKMELRVWYSSAYASKWGLPLLELNEEEKRVLEEQENDWPCFECNQRFPSSDDLQKHLNQHDEENAAQPDLVIARPRTKTKTRPKIVKKGQRMKVAYKQEDFTCEICQKVFPRNYSLQRHLIMHSGEKKYKCPICDMKFSHVYNRNRHVRRHKQRDEDELNHVIKPSKSLFKKKQGALWVCTHCDLTFDNSNVLNLHTLTHAAEDVGLDETNFLNEKFLGENPEENGDEHGKLAGENLHKCPECTQGFVSRRDLIEHASVHGKVGKQRCYRGVINPLKPFKCNLCYKSFASDERLIRHYLVHGSEDSKPLQCDVCFKRFLNNSALACHVKVHSIEKKLYECPICKIEFDQIVSLKDHVHIHCNNGVYSCPHCQKVFEEYNQIRKHIRAFHSERRYPCDKCEKIFPRPDKLKLHMLRHSDHREFLCANCGKQFKRKDKLKEHMKRMHAPEREAKVNSKNLKGSGSKRFIPKVSPTDYHRFIYKCHSCLLGFKRRGMLVNHLAKRHPDIRPESVPELNLPILKTTRDYYCQYCEKVYKSSSKRKAHILKNHPGSELPMSNRRKGGVPDIPGIPNPTFSQTVGSITTHPHHCNWCHKQYASKAKLLQHQRKKHIDMLAFGYINAKTKVEPGCDQGTQVTSQILIESVASGITPETTAVLIDATKRKIHYVNRDALLAAANQADTLPTADLLTQAMSELTQNLAEYRTIPGEFLTARLSQVVTPAAITNPSSPPFTPNSISAPTSPNSEVAATPALDQIQLSQFLSQYHQQTLNPQQLAVVVTSVSRSWPSPVTATLSNYPAR